MRVQLNENKALPEIWNIVDDAFAKFNCVKELQDDGSVMYYENPNSEDSYIDFTSILIVLASNILVVQNCLKWVWYDDEENDEGVFDEEDVLEQVKDMKFCKLVYGTGKETSNI